MPSLGIAPREQKGSIRGWLLTVARNIVIDRARAKSARPVEVAESPTAPPVEDDHAPEVASANPEYRRTGLPAA